MGENGPSMPGALPANDDPLSELNLLRRELRQLQAEARDAALQIASQQDELIELRAALAVAEADVEEGLAREGNLRTQIELQGLKRQQVEGTMAAAEALVKSLKEMVVEGEAGGVGEELGSTRLDEGMADLDQVLKRIEEEKEAGEEQGAGESSQGVAVVTKGEVPGGSGETVEAPVVYRQMSEMEDEAGTGSIAADGETSEPPATIVTQLPSQPQSLPRVATAQAQVTKRQSLPWSAAVPSAGPVTAAPGSTLLASAFKPGSTTVDHQTPAIHSSSVQPGMPLPTEVEKIAKSEGVPRRTYLPSGIATTLSDAHSGEIFALASSVDAHWVVSGGDDKVIKVYENCGGVYATVGENARAVTALGVHAEFGGDGVESVLIYSGSSDGSIRAFRRHARRKTKWTTSHVLQVHSQVVRKLLLTESHGVSGTPNLVLTCSTDRSIRMCDIEHGRKPFSVEAPSAVMDVAMFGATGNGVLVSGHKDGGIRLWSSRDGTGMVGGGKLHMKAVTSVSCLDDGYGVVSLGRDNVLRLSDIRQNIAPVREMEGGVQAVSDWHRASVNGRFVVCGSGRQGSVGVWNVDTGKLTRRISSQANDADADVLDMVARKLRNPGCVVVPLWTASGQLVCAHRSRQVSFWQCQ